MMEDYVSFETAKLLKEKGFNWNTDKQYYYLDKIVSDYNITDRSRNPERYLDAPTLQMAMKWLREVHNLYVDICPCVEEEYWNNKWNVYVSKLMNKYPFQQFIGVFSTYEEAAEAGIKYCLEILI